MGKGIITSNGIPPVEEWKIRLTLFNSEDLIADLRRLFQGKAVDSQDGRLELSCLPLREPDHHKIYVRRPHAPYMAEIVLRPLRAEDNGGVRDTRQPLPCPDQWRTKISDKVTRWELFNCVLHTLVSRIN